MSTTSVRLPALLLAAALLLAGAPAPAGEGLPVHPSAEVEAGLYGETGLVSVRLAFRTEASIGERFQVSLHLADPDSGVARARIDHAPAVATDRWVPGETVRYTVRLTVPARPDGTRPELLVLVGIEDPRVTDEYGGRLELLGEAPFRDRRYRVGRIPAASGPATVEALRSAARERRDRGELSEAFELLDAALGRAESLPEKLAVTGDLLGLPPPPPLPVTVGEELRLADLVAAEKVRWLRDRASALLREKERKLALRVLERIGGVVEEGRNTKVVGEPTGEERATKDVIDVKSRLLRDLPEEELAEFRKLVEKAEDDPEAIREAALVEIRRERLVLARRLLVEAQLHRDAGEKLKERIREELEELEQRIFYELTPEEEERLARETDHPAFHRTASVPTSRFILLGPEEMVRAIPRASSYRLDVACSLLTDLFGRNPAAGGERIVVYYKETYSGPATGGGDLITVGDADPAARDVRLDTGLYYHELTHCVDDTRPVHDYKRGLTEGLANVGAIFVADMFAGKEGRFEALSRAGREALRAHHLDRENAYWLIPAYGPSEGMLCVILERHAPAGNGRVDWPKLGRVFRLYRESATKSPLTHRIMAHLGFAFAQAMGEGVWDTLRELRFPVDRSTGDEVAELDSGGEEKLRMLARRGDVDGLLAHAELLGPVFGAARARYAALALLGARGEADGERAEAVRRRLGVVDRFHVIGPFYPETGAGLAELLPPERRLDLGAEYVTSRGVARWVVPERGAGHFGRLDGRGVVELRYGYPELAVSYALAHLSVPEDTDALFWLGADDEVALWVNGVQVERNHGDRPLVPDWERWPGRLRAGRNRIVVKIANRYGGTGFSLRVTDALGQPIPGAVADLDPPGELPAPRAPRWEKAFRDTFQRKSLGRDYDVAAGEFTVSQKALRGGEKGARPGWRPFSVRPGFPQDRPAALLWLANPRKEPPPDFLWRVTLARPAVPKLVLTWDGEGNDLPLSGWSLVLVPDRNGRAFTARLERYDYLHYVTRAEVPEEWAEPVVEVRRLADRVSVTLGGAVVFDGVSAPPLARRRFGLAVWGPEAAVVGLELAHPRD